MRMRSGAKILLKRIVDDAHEEKSKWCARVFAKIALVLRVHDGSVIIYLQKT